MCFMRFYDLCVYTLHQLADSLCCCVVNSLKLCSLYCTDCCSLFPVLQASMDLPPDKAKVLRQYDSSRKWEMICDQVGLVIIIMVVLSASSSEVPGCAGRYR